MTEADALLELQDLCATAKKPQLDDDTLKRVLKRTAREDGSYNLRDATHQAWMLKTAQASSLMSTSDGSQKFELQQIYAHCLEMAALYAPAFVV